jgi:hypothetical protein
MALLVIIAILFGFGLRQTLICLGCRNGDNAGLPGALPLLILDFFAYDYAAAFTLGCNCQSTGAAGGRVDVSAVHRNAYFHDCASILSVRIFADGDDGGVQQVVVFIVSDSVLVAGILKQVVQEIVRFALFRMQQPYLLQPNDAEHPAADSPGNESLVRTRNSSGVNGNSILRRMHVDIGHFLTAGSAA